MSASGTILSTTETVYNPKGQIARTIAADGQITDREYDSLGREVASVGHPIAVSSLELPEALMATITDAPGTKVRLRSETIYVDGKVEKQVTNIFVIMKPDGSTLTNRDFRQETVFEYDLQGNAVKTTRNGFAGGASPTVSVFTTAEFDSHGHRVAETDEMGLTTNFEFDAQGRLTAVVLPEVPHPDTGVATRPRYEYGYDAQGNQTLIRDAAGRETLFTFDAQGRQTSRELPLVVESPASGDFTEYFDCLDSRGRLTMHISFAGIGTRSVFDADSGLLSEQRFYSTVPACNANPDTPDAIWTRSYDEFGREKTVVQDTDGNVVTTTDQRTTTTAYNPTGAIASVASSEGTIHYGYDSLGRQIRTWTGMDEQSVRTDTWYRFDLLGRLSQVDLKVQDGVTLSTPEVTEYIYDLLGNLEQVRGTNGVIADYAYDPLNRLELLRHFKDVNSNGTYESAVDALLAEFDYHLRADGKRTGVTETDDLGRVTRIDWTYDGAGRLVREAFDSHDNDLDFVTDYQFDLVGNRLAKLTDTNPDWTALAGGASPSFDKAINYSYDSNDRLLTESLDTTGDGVAEKTTVHGWFVTHQASKTEWQGSDTDPGTGTKLSQTDFQFNLQGRMSGATVDSDGDGTVESTSTYGYDSRGIRVSQAVNGVTTQYLFDHQNPTGYAQVIEEINSSGHLIRSYTLGLDVISQYSPDFAMDVRSLQFLYDGHGSTRALTNAVGSIAVGGVSQSFAFDAYGNAKGFTESTAATLILYSGEWSQRDIPYQYLRARFYNAETGRFDRDDPFFGNLPDPQSLHKYLYVHGDPIQGKDPSGLFTSVEMISISTMSAHVRQADDGPKVSVGVGAQAGIQNAAIQSSTHAIMAITGSAGWSALEAQIVQGVMAIFATIIGSVALRNIMDQQIQIDATGTSGDGGAPDGGGREPGCACVQEFDAAPLDRFGRASGAGAVFGGGAIARGTDFTGYPTWWNEANLPTTGGERWRRGHLIAASLGGPGGVDYRNLAAIHEYTNNAFGNRGMRGFEDGAMKAGLAGECIVAFVVPVFLSDSFTPDAIVIEARGDKGYKFEHVIPNRARP